MSNSQKFANDEVACHISHFYPHIASAPHGRCIKDARGLDVVKEGVGRCTVDGTAGRRDDIDEMVSNTCIHKKINHYLLTLLFLHIVAEGTTKMCVQILHQIANDRGWFQHRDGAAVMV
jgi:hypothetical protein